MKTLKTEGIKYMGSKLKMLPYIMEAINGLDIHTVLDAFSGTTRVSQMFSQIGFDTTSNDTAIWSNVFGNCYLVANKDNAFYQDYIDELNSLKGKYGWFSEKYGGEDSCGKKPFRLHNTMKLDSIRERIDTYNLDWSDKCVLLTSLIMAMDSVDNTLGHYSSYLKGWCSRSLDDMHMKLPKKFTITTKNVVTQVDAIDSVCDRYDLIYLDPPYGSNNEKMPSCRVRYNAYYHIWKSVILNDKPEVFGKVNRRLDTRDTISASVFEEFKVGENGRHIAVNAFDELISKANARYILISYGSGGITTKNEINDIIHSYGKLIMVKEIDYKKNVMSNMRWTNEWVNSDGEYNEYLFLIEK